MGKRRRRRTRSDEGGTRTDIEDGVSVEWPGLTGKSIFTVEGQIEQTRAVSLNLAHAKGWRGVTARFLWLFRVPPLAAARLIRDV